jgi:hypothetical protein
MLKNSNTAVEHHICIMHLDKVYESNHFITLSNEKIGTKVTKTIYERQKLAIQLRYQPRNEGNMKFLSQTMTK